MAQVISRRAPAPLTISTMTASTDDCKKRFQAAVDVIQNLPKNGAYRPSYEVMLRFYSLYKQAVCGPCSTSRPGFWDPVGRYKWDAWSRLGDMSSEAAMTAYVEEMKKVAQEVIDNMPVNEKTASLFHYFEPLYLVIHDMPQPPEALLSLRAELKGSTQATSPAEDGLEKSSEEEPTIRPPIRPRNSSDTQDAVNSECLVVTSDSESEIFCDTLEQLDQTKVQTATQVGVGQGGEEVGESWGPPKRGRSLGRETRHGRREETGGRLYGGVRHPNEGTQGGGDGWEGGAVDRPESQMMQQIIFALRRLQEDMRSVMERLEAVERLTATQAMEWRAPGHQVPSVSEEAWWSPLSKSSRTVLLLLLWPFVVHWLMFLLRRKYRKSNV